LWNANNILYDLQHGFRKARSCVSQLFQFIQELNANNTDKNIQTDLIIMDFAKAIYNDIPELTTAEITGRKGDMQINPDGTKTMETGAVP
jgi:hypothetical protein